jgi:hypothetical protein
MVLFFVISNKLDGVGATMDQVELASVAYQIGKEELGNFLLNKNSVKSRCVPLYLQHNEWSKAVEAAEQSNDTALLVYVLEEAKKAGNTSFIQDSLKKYPSAVHAWLSLFPNEADKVEILLQLNRKQDALMIQFDEVIETKGKKLKTIKEKTWAFDAYSKVRDLWNKKQQPDWVNYPPLTVFSKLLDINDPAALKEAKHAYQMTDDEVLWAKVHKYAEKETPALANELAKSDESNLRDMFDHFKDLGKSYLSEQIINAITNPNLKALLLNPST